MDGQRFDDLVKTLSTVGTSRRRVLAMLGVAVAGGVGRLLGGAPEVAGAASHLCCTYVCGETYTTSCSRQGSCPPPPVGCSVVAGSSYYVRRCKDCAVRTPPPAACPPDEHCTGGQCCPEGYVACPGNLQAGCLPEATACSGEPVCCSNNGLGAAIVCGFEGQCQAGSAPPPATCPPLA